MSDFLESSSSDRLSTCIKKNDLISTLTAYHFSYAMTLGILDGGEWDGLEMQGR